MPQPVNRQQVLEHERRTWHLRCRGWAQTRIADSLGLSQPAVSKILRRIELRELKRLAGSVERIKATQNGQLEHILEEALDAWHRSKAPKKRASSRTQGGAGDGPGGTVTTQEAIERDGDPVHLYCAMQALAHQRSLFGLDVMPSLAEPAASVAELARDLLTRAAAYEQREAVENAERHPAGNDGTDPAGTPAVLE
jgi:hypothetical protein